jgi:hypothetical protein
LQQHAFLKLVYFQPGVQSLGLTTEDLLWTGNKNGMLFGRRAKISVDLPGVPLKNKTKVLSPWFCFSTSNCVIMPKTTNQYEATLRN